MTIIRRFSYSNDKQITVQKSDEQNNFLWLAFAKNSENNCIIEKQAFAKPNQTYFSLERSVDEVVAMDIDSTKLYIAYDDPSLLGEIINTSTPLSVTTEISKGLISESPVDVLINNTDLWYLLPGNLSGTNSKLLKYDTSGNLQQTVDLSKSGSIVVNAKSMTIDSNDDIWIVTYTDPATVVRVFEISGGSYDFDITEIV